MNKPWNLIEVGPETQCNVVVFDHSLHVACLSADVFTGTLKPWTRRVLDLLLYCYYKSNCILMCYHRNNQVSCTLRISSVARWCFEWISSCKFMRTFWYFWPSWGSVTSLRKSSNSSTSCKNRFVMLEHTADNSLEDEALVTSIFNSSKSYFCPVLNFSSWLLSLNYCQLT